MMNLEKLKLSLIADEGKRLDVYKDHLGFNTVGVGHLCVGKNFRELGSRITEEECFTLLEEDIAYAIEDCEAIFATWYVLDAEAKEICVNMAFNLGRRRLSKFKNMIAALEKGDYPTAANEMKDSLWYTQVKDRAARLVDRMGAIKGNLKIREKLKEDESDGR
jgi:lysozyme